MLFTVFASETSCDSVTDMDTDVVDFGESDGVGPGVLCVAESSV